jgi:hypothetical protein
VLVASGGPAAGRIDLVSVLAHELGHAAGLEHADGGVMAETLAAGVRSVAPATWSRVPGTLDQGGLDQGGTRAPAIDWKLQFAEPAWGSRTQPAPSADWQADFVNHLGKTAEQRNPNASCDCGPTPRLRARCRRR